MFITKIEELLNGCGQPVNLVSFQKMVNTWLGQSTQVTFQEKKDYLLKLSNPAKNHLLWRQLKPEVMPNLAYDEVSGKS